MLPIQKTLDSAKNIRQEIREGNLLFKTTSDSSYASATLERITERASQASPEPSDFTQRITANSPRCV